MAGKKFDKVEDHTLSGRAAAEAAKKLKTAPAVKGLKAKNRWPGQN